MRNFRAFQRTWWCQVKALTRKNWLVQKRSPVTTAAQLGVGLLFLFMLSIMKWSISTLNDENAIFIDDKHPEKTVIGKLPRCTPGCEGCLCHAFVYAPANARTKEIVDAMLADNPDGIAATPDHAAGAPFGVRAFANQSVVDEWLVTHPNTTNAAVLFRRDARWAEDKASFAYDLQPVEILRDNTFFFSDRTALHSTAPDASFPRCVCSAVPFGRVNTSETCLVLGVLECTDPLGAVKVPMQVALDQAFVRTHGGPGTASISITISNVPHPPVQHISAQNTAVMLLCV